MRKHFFLETADAVACAALAALGRRKEASGTFKHEVRGCRVSLWLWGAAANSVMLGVRLLALRVLRACHPCTAAHMARMQLLMFLLNMLPSWLAERAADAMDRSRLAVLKARRGQ